jgi:hypothetical protein
MICLDIKFHLPGFSSLLHLDITKNERNFCVIAMLAFPFPTHTSEICTSVMLIWFLIGKGKCGIRLLSNRKRFIPSFLKMCHPIWNWKWGHTLKVVMLKSAFSVLETILGYITGIGLNSCPKQNPNICYQSPVNLILYCGNEYSNVFCVRKIQVIPCNLVIPRTPKFATAKHEWYDIIRLVSINTTLYLNWIYTDVIYSDMLL